MRHIILICGFLGGCGAGGGSSDRTTTSPSLPLPSLNISSDLVEFEEKSASEINLDILIPDGFDVSFSNSLDLNLSPSLSEDKTSVVLSIPSVTSDTKLEFVVSLQNATTLLSDSVSINILDVLPNKEESYTISSSTGQKLTNLIDGYANKMANSEFYIDGLIVSEADSIAHSKRIDFIEYDPAQHHINNLPENNGPWFVGTESLYEYVVIKNANSEIFLVKNNEFNVNLTKTMREQNDTLPSVVLWSLSDESAIFRYAYLHNNTNFINALVLAFKSTSDDKYLQLAEKTASKVVRMLSGGLYKRQFLNELSPTYTGMNQAIIIDSLYMLSKYSQNKKLYSDVKLFAGHYSHTTEGVWNHFSNSAIGGLVVSELGIDFGIDVDKELNSKFPSLINEIQRLNGNIPYFIDTEDFRYNNFSSGYHTYDAMLISKVSLYTDGRFGVSDVLPLVLNKIEVNYSNYYANNVETLMYIFMAEGFVDHEYAQQQANGLVFNTNDINRHISYLRAASAFLWLHEHTAHPALEFSLY